MTNGTEERVLIVGWDGATFDLITPWVQQGRLPHTARLIAEGAQRQLLSTIPTLSPPAWTSLITGKNPGRHGTFDFVRRQPGAYDLQTARNDLPSLGTVFHWVSQAGKKVGVLNVPFTYPPEPVNGFMVSGLGAAPQWKFTYPAELRHELLAQGYAIDFPIAYREGNDQAYLEAVLATTRRQADVALQLMRDRAWDLFMVVFTGIDQVLSFLWHHFDPTHPRHDPALAFLGEGVLTLHQLLDTVLGEMMEIAGASATIALVSDHGMGPLYKEVFLNNWLRSRGYLVMREMPRPATGYQRIMRRLGITREGIWRRIGRARTQAIKRRLPASWQRLVPTEHPSLADHVDWERTRAYSFGNVGQIYINLAGREPRGIVQPGAEYRAVVDALARDLRDLTDPQTGERLVDAVYHREELYDGPFLEQAPDLNLIMRNYSYITQMRRELASHELVAPSVNMSGFHRREGIFIARGPAVVRGAYAPADITAVTPTVLHLMGLPIPDDMDGQVMTDLCAPDLPPPQRLSARGRFSAQVAAPTLSAQEEEEMLKRLKDLGYLA